MFAKRACQAIIILAFALLAVMPCQALAGYIEPFSNDNAGWLDVTVNDGGGQALSASGWSSVASGQAGYITGTVTAGSDRLFGMQPADTHLYGSMTGLALETEYKIDGQVTGPGTPMVRFYVGDYSGGRNDYFVTSDAFSWNPNAGPGWTAHMVSLIASSFVEWPNQASHSRTFDQVIAAPEDIGLVFTGASNLFGSNQNLGFRSDLGATISIAQFGTISMGSMANNVPEPATLTLLALGGFAFVRGRPILGRFIGT